MLRPNEAPTKELTGIEVTVGPTKTGYVEGETFDPSGMVVVGNYSDGTTEVITDYTYEPTRALTSEDQYVLIYYQSFQAQVEITVLSGRQLINVRVERTPDKTEYTVGETFDPSGMIIEGDYSDGTTEVITDYTYEPTRALTLEDYAVTVFYGGAGTTIGITVHE